MSAGLELVAALNLLAAMVWIGGLFAIEAATLAARATLAPLQQVEFFRGLGHRYGLLSCSALLVFAVTGLLLIGAPASWSAEEAALAGLTALVAALTGAAVAAARVTQRLAWESATGAATDADTGRRRDSWRRLASWLRMLIAAASLAALGMARL
ncbi:MAG: hypothetical protein KDB58_04200 [Solirubrobacterales bacterium]|nr:hypothetical protein [Solirubrobacterales bacterium]MCB8971005.1 hypothetical protein [Thermoleophilales bacterium]MCO5326101.1 hypothetical protein [Solirubrobacterales bacterium]